MNTRSPCSYALANPAGMMIAVAANAMALQFRSLKLKTCVIRAIKKSPSKAHSRRSSSRTYRANGKRTAKTAKCPQGKRPSCLAASMWLIAPIMATNKPVASGSRITRIHSVPSVIGLKTYSAKDRRTSQRFAPQLRSPVAR